MYKPLHDRNNPQPQDEIGCCGYRQHTYRESWAVRTGSDVVSQPTDSEGGVDGKNRTHCDELALTHRRYSHAWSPWVPNAHFLCRQIDVSCQKVPNCAVHFEREPCEESSDGRSRYYKCAICEPGYHPIATPPGSERVSPARLTCEIARPHDDCHTPEDYGQDPVWIHQLSGLIRHDSPLNGTRYMEGSILMLQ